MKALFLGRNNLVRLNSRSKLALWDRMFRCQKFKTAVIHFAQLYSQTFEVISLLEKACNLNQCWTFLIESKRLPKHLIILQCAASTPSLNPRGLLAGSLIW